MTRQVYLDYAATTPIHPDVRNAMLRALDHDFGNPSSLHWAGRRAAALVEQARGQVARAIGGAPEEIIFTSGATEADNLALAGTLRARPEGGHLITCAVEHHAILHAAEALARAGHAVSILPVDGQGHVDPDAVRRAIRPDTALISIMWANNEVGTIQPVAEIAAVAHEHEVPFHTDAVQAIATLDVDVQAAGVDLLSLSAHKIYGPKGVGALYVRAGNALEPLLYGGSQEAGLRPGTENVPGIVGLGAAASLAACGRDGTRAHLARLRRALIEALRQIAPDVIINGPEQAVAPHIVSASFPGTDGEMLLFMLSQAGIACSMGSACTAEDMEPSHVLMAMGLPLPQIDGTLRFSLGSPASDADIAILCEALPNILAQCRAV